MHASFNSKEKTMREMTDIALSAGWQITEVVRVSETSLYCTITAVPVQIPPSKTLVRAGG